MIPAHGGHRARPPGEDDLRAGIPGRRIRWTDAQRAVVIANQDWPVHDVALLVGRDVISVYSERTRLIRRDLLQPRIAQPRRSDR